MENWNLTINLDKQKLEMLATILAVNQSLSWSTKTEIKFNKKHKMNKNEKQQLLKLKI